ncbi:MAG: two-component system, OmpR family, alkaline phosphatase synthesis response regulator PhoP [Actinomycetota bacterium]|nr:two-component system, OmpR family, alkaline phosphatase synthesis response regulator PhoP [Actinomycetota bacterium]
MARIHIADDEPDIRQLLTFLLAEEGHEVSVSVDGRAAVEKMLLKPPDLLVLDLMMPDMDGYVVLEEMMDYQTLGSTRVLILTAKGAEQDRQKGFELGADEYLVKPCDEGEFRASVANLLAQSKEELRLRREDLKDKARLLSQLESVVEQGHQTA